MSYYVLFIAGERGVTLRVVCIVFTDLGLFSTKSLVEANADHAVEVRTQVNLKMFKVRKDHQKKNFLMHSIPVDSFCTKSD